MINGNILNVGDEFEVDVRGRAVTVKLEAITVKPATVVLEFDGQQLIVPLTQGPNGE